MIDIWSWLALLAMPFWVAGWTWVFARLLDWTAAKRGRFPIYMGAAFTIAVPAIGVPVTMIGRQLERSFEFERCVEHANARDLMNGCPAWTVRALKAQDGGGA